FFFFVCFFVCVFFFFFFFWVGGGGGGVCGVGVGGGRGDEEKRQDLVTLENVQLTLNDLLQNNHLITGG
ncbi:hypothetical protein C4813_24500, partial [Salmonella enterica subsp. enterica serovar Rubislaw]